MNDTFYMWPINEVGEEIEAKGHKVLGAKYGLAFDIYITIINDIRLFIDEITGMVVFAEYNEKKVKNWDEYAEAVLTNTRVIADVRDIHANCIKENIILSHNDKVLEVLFPKQDLITKRTTKTRDSIGMDFMNKFNLREYFKYLFVSKDFGQQTTSSNSLLITPMNYVLPYGRKDIDVDFVNNGMVKLENVPNSNCLIMPQVIRRGTIDTVINLKFGRYNVGYYVPTINVLIIGDFIANKDFSWIKEAMEYMKKFYFQKKKYAGLSDEIEITMGCDPEFELYNSEGNLLTGEDLNAEGRLQKKIGADGHGRQLELRPEPSTDVKEVIEDLTNLFKAVSHLRVDAKGDKEPLGGHIHFGVVSKTGTAALQYTNIVIDALDTFIGRHTVPMNGRARGEYGRLGDVRNQPWGFEYRVPPAGIFATKEMAYITLKLAQGIVTTLMTKDIKCSIPVKKDDLKPFLTDEEIEYYMEFPKKEFKKIKSTDILQYWTTEKAEPVELKFYDKWNPSVKEQFKVYLKDTIIDDKTTICLYGLKGEKHSGINSIRENTPHPRGIHCEEGIAIGLPRSVRVDGDSVRSICSEIKRKIGSINGTTVKRTTANLFPDEMIGSAVTKDAVDLEEI